MDQNRKLKLFYFYNLIPFIFLDINKVEVNKKLWFERLYLSIHYEPHLLFHTKIKHNNIFFK